MSDTEDNHAAEPAINNNLDDDNLDADDSDKESDILSDVDENQFEDYNPETANIEERPVDIDEDVAKTLKASKRKRLDGESSKKTKEGKRPKKRKSGGVGAGNASDDDDDFTAADGHIMEGKRRRPGAAAAAAGAGGDRSSKGAPRKKVATPEPDDADLTPDQRRAREIDRAMDAAVKGVGKKRRTKKDDIDLEDETEDQIRVLADSMPVACEADNRARQEGRPAVNKLKLLPAVAAVLNRSNAQTAVLDPETRMIEGVKFFLEPLNDGSLPAYNIQRELFTAMTKLPIEKELLLSSQIGKVVLFYTRSKKAQPDIKRMAERLLGEWSRPILKRTDDYRKRYIETRELDLEQLKLSQSQTASQRLLTKSSIPHRPNAASQASRDAALAPVTNPTRAKPVGLPQSYTIAPQSTFDPHRAAQGVGHRPIGAGGAEAFRRMVQKKKAKS